MFGHRADSPFNPNTAYNHARKAWTRAREIEDEQDIIPEPERIRRIGLHEHLHHAPQACGEPSYSSPDFAFSDPTSGRSTADESNPRPTMISIIE